MNKPQVDFYIVTSEADYLRTFARLCSKLYTRQLTAYVYCNDTMSMHQLDEYLWTFDDLSFIPHSLYAKKIEAPILLGEATSQVASFPVTTALINLTTSVPSFYNQYARVIEIIKPNERQKGRERYQSYKDQTLEPNVHKI